MKKFICILLCLSFFTTSILTAQNFKVSAKDDSRETTAASGRKHRDAPRRPRSHGEYLADTFGELMLDLFVYFLIDISVETNRHVLFDDFPYATSDFFIYYDEKADSISEDEIIGKESTPVNYEVISYKNLSRYDVGANFTYFPNSVTFVPNFRLDGYVYKFIGPVVEVSNFINFNHYTPYFGNVKLGMELATFQTFLFNWSWNFEWVAYYGEAFTNGGNVGFLVKSYPFDPLVLEYRFNASILYDYRNDYSWASIDPSYVLESYLEAGVMIDNSPWEAYVGWKYLYDGPAQIDDHGFTVGAKYHF